MRFAEKLIKWNATQPVRYPWIGETDPYRILLSEFLLQQTRSAQALPYYQLMLATFPTVHHLANAPEDLLMKTWQGLGYYSRARNLHKTAKAIVQTYDGAVPDSYSSLLELPGIGPYSAAAISSFAFGERRAVVDGNVFRVLARHHAISTPVNSPKARKEFTDLAMKLLRQQDPGRFNQAIMNLGAHVCTPKNPVCHDCPVQSTCQALVNRMQSEFPVKKKKSPNRDRFFHYFEIDYRNSVLIEKRDTKDIWAGLYQFPLIERSSNRQMNARALHQQLQALFGLTSFKLEAVTRPRKQVLSHQNIHARFYQITTRQKPRPIDEKITLVIRENLENFAFPRTVSWYIKQDQT